MPLLALVCGSAVAQGVVPPPSGVLTLTTSAALEVPKDTMAVTFTSTREGTDAQAVQAALKQALDAALAEARKVARAGQVEVQTGNFALQPRYGAPGPRGAGPLITGWQGSAELVVQGKDMSAIAQLTGRIGTMTIARVAYSLSREAHEKIEAEAVAQAIARWRARAQQMSQQFGYNGYTVREVNVATNEPGGPVVPMMRAKAMAAAGVEALPVEAGQAEVTATVSGTAQMTR
ncbi:MAG TPA: SIMPL domain-containing protein [Burkholderiaceae bacterium]|nr:SIMPL domain-containing protein [Burkholderiaceae bacterium]